MNVSGKNDIYVSYILNKVTGKKIPFPVTPSGITETISANFTQQDIIGASVPRIVYASTSAKTMSLSLQNLSDEYIAEGFTSLLQYVYALQALVYPQYVGDDGLVKAPDLILVLGDRSMSCVCTNVSVAWNDLVRGQRNTMCNVDLQLLMTRPSIPGATDIELKG